MTELERFQILREKGYDYNSNTGQILSREGKERQGTVSGYSYLSFHIKGKTYTVYAHRYAIWYVHGEIPEVVDHINGNRRDNRLSNLRDGSYLINAQNVSVVKPYPKKPLNGKYQAQIRIGDKYHYIGRFDTLECCYKATILGKLMFHPGYSPSDKDLEILNNPSIVVDMTKFYKKMKNIQKQQMVEAFAHPIENIL